MFYYKFISTQTKKGATEILKEECMRGPQDWRNRIGMQTSRLMKKKGAYDTIIHRRIAGYFALYSGMVNFQTFMLISHRNHISVFDMIEKAWLHCMHSFRKAEFVRIMAVKKLPKDARGKAKRSKAMQEHQK